MKCPHCQQEVDLTSVVLCKVPGCSNEAEYEGWYTKKDPLTGKSSGHMIRIEVCLQHLPILNGYKEAKG